MSEDSTELKTLAKISDARAIVKKYDGQAAVIILVRKDGVIDTVTYGETKEKCKVIGWWAKLVGDKGLSVVPFQTIFGWGNGGVPKPLTDEERKSVANMSLPEYLFGKIRPGLKK